jgi:hypothetical protein
MDAATCVDVQNGLTAATVAIGSGGLGIVVWLPAIHVAILSPEG